MFLYLFLFGMQNWAVEWFHVLQEDFIEIAQQIGFCGELCRSIYLLQCLHKGW